MVESKEGAGGGYRLSRSAKLISVGEVLEVLDGPVKPVSCMREEGCVCEPYCSHKQVMTDVASVVAKAMDEKSIADLIG